MYDFAFDKKTLNDTLNSKDFIDTPLLVDPLVRDATLAQAVAISRLGFPNLNLKSAAVRGKRLYQFANLHDALVVRKLGRNIGRLTRVKQSDRDTIIRSMKVLLEEGHSFRVYRLDVKSFYESISRNEISAAFKRDAGFPPASSVVWNSFSQQLAQLNVAGMPRGLAISALISEYLMRDFDVQARRMPGVYFYARYVDDIFILTTTNHDPVEFKAALTAHLSNGLSFNYVKTRVLTFNAPALAHTAPFFAEYSFDFLGYQFAVSSLRKQGRKQYRVVRLDISKSKVKKIKSRLIASARRFGVGGSFKDYADRVKILSGNYNIYDRHSGHRRNVGIYFNYAQIDSATSEAIPELDRFWQSLAMSKAVLGAVSLTKAQRTTLLSHSFDKSFLTKRFFYFKPVRLAELTECWAYA